MKQSLNLVLLPALLVLSTGCSSGLPADDVNPAMRDDLLASISHDDRAYDERVETALTEAASSVSQSLIELAKIEKATHPKAKMKKAPDAKKIHMADLATVDWDGPVEPLVQKIAKASHYKVRVLGTEPTIPILVSISVQDTALADILRNIMFQVEQHATIQLYPKERVIELRYLDA